MSDDERTQMIASMAPSDADRPRRDPGPVALQDEDDGQHSRRGAVLWTAAIVVLLLVIAGGAYLIFKPGKRDAAVVQPTQVTVPNFVGLTSAQAVARIDDSKLKLAGSPKSTNDNADCAAAKRGTVCTQDPLPNQTVNENTPVTLTVYAGPVMVQTPYVVDQQLSAAVAAITQAGLVAVPTPRPSNQPRLTVLDQKPKNTVVPKGSSVTLYYSSGQLMIPDVTGLSDAAARQKLNQAGFNSISAKDGTDPNTDTKNAGKVSRTDPAEGSTVNASTTITIFVYATPKPTCTTASTPSSPSGTGTATGTPTGTPTGTATGTPTGTATGTATGTPTGTPTGTGSQSLPAC